MSFWSVWRRNTFITEMTPFHLNFWLSCLLSRVTAITFQTMFQLHPPSVPLDQCKLSQPCVPLQRNIAQSYSLTQTISIETSPKGTIISKMKDGVDTYGSTVRKTLSHQGNANKRGRDNVKGEYCKISQSCQIVVDKTQKLLKTTMKYFAALMIITWMKKIMMKKTHITIRIF
uniref:Uncharacterized protein n=1 Tax=Noccaea caerulescens TaxID=107243 RepID=A0A1J3FEV3_NOCCA